MSYLVLARKYRPQTFAEVAGQSTVTSVLCGAITSDRVGHAYLFTGPRGTGKTTCARLFAKALNCAEGPREEPCGTCERCRAMDAGAEIDTIEIDAASNTGVDHVRELRDQAAYVPLRARNKVYIIDEVHMLSKAAFNALLKTLEEPPPHVKFLFATTELHKVPDTILSRCQVLRLGPLDAETIRVRLDEVFTREGVQAQAGVSQDLARRARGSLRDALSITDQLLALAGSRPTLADCERLSEEGSLVVIDGVIETLIASDRAGLLEALPATTGDEAELLSALLDRLRACLLCALCGDGAPVLPDGAGDQAALADQGRRVGARRLETWLQELLHARERMRLLPSHARLILEVTLLDLARTDSSVGLDELTARLEALEGRLQADPAAPAPRAPDPTDSQAKPAPDPQASRPSPAPAGQGSDAPPRVRTTSAAEAWAGFLEVLGETSSSLRALLDKRGRLEEYRKDRVVVKLANMVEEEHTLIRDRRNQKACAQAFCKAVGRELEVVFQDGAEERPAEQDPFTNEVSQLFDGRVVD